MPKDAQYMRPPGRDLSYRTLFDLINDGLLILDLEGYIRELNRTAYERLGYARDELIGCHVSRLYTPEYAERVPSRIREVLRRGSAVFEVTSMRKDGSVMPVEINARLIDLEGERCILSGVRDVSERKMTEEALALTQIAVDCSIDAVYWKDMEGRILKVNDQACRSLGYTREEVLGMRAWDVDPNIIAADWQEIVSALRRNGSLHLESTHRRKDGSTFPVEV
ncbi:MAG TPA: PAS domain S-box protein, partial [Gammaproteobacteria bacterium]|nr:PAS domain S-box protein [Gammaproteobacteria bacterium]